MNRSEVVEGGGKHDCCVSLSLSDMWLSCLPAWEVSTEPGSTTPQH